MRVLELCEYQGNTVSVREICESIGSIPLRMSEVYGSIERIG